MPSYMINDGGLGSLFASAVGGGFDKRAEADAYRIRQAMDLAKNADERAAALNAAQTQLLGAKTADQNAKNDLFGSQVAAANDYGSALANSMADEYIKSQAGKFLKEKDTTVPATTDDLMIGLHARQPFEEVRQYLPDSVFTVPEHVRNLFDSQSRVAALSMPGNKPVETVKALQMLDPLNMGGGGNGDNGPEAYGTPQPYRRKDGSIGFIQPTKAGGAPAIMPLPEDGAEWLLPTTAVNLGTEQQFRNRVGDVVDSAQIDNYGASKDKARGDREGKAIADAPGNLNKAAVSGAQSKATFDLVSEDIDHALDLSRNGGWVPTTGFTGHVGSYIPGTAAHDLSQTLLTIKANIGFERLQEMRDASPTGGALGQVSEQENALLQAVWGALGQSQSQEQFERNLERLKVTLASSQERIKNAFLSDYYLAVSRGVDPSALRAAAVGFLGYDPTTASSEPATETAPRADTTSSEDLSDDDILKMYGG